YMSVNDVRALEDMRGVEAGDQFRVPLQNIPLTEAGVISAQQLVTAGYTPESVAQYLDMPVEFTGLPSVQLQPTPEPASEDE
ncbi:MAG TPA: hypothetical protein VIG24_14805, partial [Acidimicrobiia bacterium]